MIDNKLGELLFDAGWSQGVLLPALPYTVVYHIDNPLSKIAKTAKKQTIVQLSKENTSSPAELPKHGVANGITRKDDSLVVVSQDCDIVSSLSDEPNVVAMRAFVTDNQSILRYAGSNSSHYFLLNPGRGLIAESSILVLIEKPVLATLTPEPGVTDEKTKLRFSRWIAHRFDRYAFPENIVGAVIKPILENFSKLQMDNAPILEALDTVREVRLAKVIGKPPYEVRLLFIIPENGLPDKGIGLARLVSEMKTWFNPMAAQLVAWEARHLYEISVGDYLDTQQIYLDHYTYRGRIIQGLFPPPLL
jgi:phage anti-repressor protein